MRPYFRCLAALTLIATLIGCDRESPVLVEVRPSQDVPGTLEVSLRPPEDTKVNVDESQREATSRFPATSTSLSETVDGHSLIGVLATGSGDRVKVLAARQPDSDTRIRVIVETTRRLHLIVRFDKNESTELGPVAETVSPGDYDLIATPAGISKTSGF